MLENVEKSRLLVRFLLFSWSVVVVQESVFQRNTLEIEQDTWNANGKALRVPRAVNIG